MLPPWDGSQIPQEYRTGPDQVGGAPVVFRRSVWLHWGVGDLFPVPEIGPWRSFTGGPGRGHRDGVGVGDKSVSVKWDQYFDRGRPERRLGNVYVIEDGSYGESVSRVQWRVFGKDSDCQSDRRREVWTPRGTPTPHTAILNNTSCEPFTSHTPSGTTFVEWT